MSSARPRGSGASRRERTSSRTSTMREIACRARAISAADIWAKSLRCSTSWSETVRLRSMSISGASSLPPVLESGEQRFLDPGGAGLRFRRRAGGLRQQHRHHLLEIAAPAEKQPERLVEQHGMLVLTDEHRMQRPVEIASPADACDLHGFKRIQHRAGTDRNAGGPQRAGESTRCSRQGGREGVSSIGMQSNPSLTFRSTRGGLCFRFRWVMAYANHPVPWIPILIGRPKMLPALRKVLSRLFRAIDEENSTWVQWLVAKRSESNPRR